MSLPILYNFLDQAQEKGCFSLYSAFLIENASLTLSKGCSEEQIKSCIEVYAEACNLAQMSGKMELKLNESFKIYVLLNRLLEEKQNELDLKKQEIKAKEDAKQLPDRAKQEKERIINETNKNKEEILKKSKRI